MNKAEAVARVAALLRSKVDFTFAEFVAGLQALGEPKKARLVELMQSGNREGVWKILVDVVQGLDREKARAQAQAIVTNQGISLDNLDKVL